MKIIDILAGKETPKKFKYNAGIFERQNNGGYIDEDGDNLTEWIFSDYSNIYDEVEIIEEDKEIEKIKILHNVGNSTCISEFTDKQHLNNHLLKDKINELIDKVNNMENNK